MCVWEGIEGTMGCRASPKCNIDNKYTLTVPLPTASRKLELAQQLACIIISSAQSQAGQVRKYHPNLSVTLPSTRKDTRHLRKLV